MDLIKPPGVTLNIRKINSRSIYFNFKSNPDVVIDDYFVSTIHIEDNTISIFGGKNYPKDDNQENYYVCENLEKGLARLPEWMRHEYLKWKIKGI